MEFLTLQLTQENPKTRKKEESLTEKQQRHFPIFLIEIQNKTTAGKRTTNNRISFTLVEDC